MIYNQDLEYDKINIHKKQDHFNGYTYIPIKYDNEDIIIQTPKLFIPFNISSFNNKRYLDLSFQNIKNDKLITQLKNNLDLIYKKINIVLKKYSIKCFIKNNYNNNLQMRFKVLDNTLFFDHNKKKINSIENLTYGAFIIHLQGLWLINNIITFDWIILQGKIDMPLYLSEYAFIDKEINKGKGKGKGKSIPPPPPPLNNYISPFNKLLKIGLSKEVIEHKMKMERVSINPNDLQNIKLKKTITVEKKPEKDLLLEELKKRFRQK